MYTGEDNSRSFLFNVILQLNKKHLLVTLEYD